MSDLRQFYLSALAIGYSSKQTKVVLGWDTAKGKTQAELNEALVYLNQQKQGKR